MQGVHLPDGEAPCNAGEYAWMPYANWSHRPPFFTGDGEWHLIAPDGRIGAIRERDGAPTHTWVIHDDGSVTFSPSLVMPSGWHGYLERGVWRSC
jgi:hypothetical protein